MYRNVHKGFVDTCIVAGISSLLAVRALAKVANYMEKQALSAQHQGMLIGGLGGAGLGAGIGGLLGGWRGAGIGGLAGAGIGTATGAALAPMALEAFEKYKNRQKFLRKREGEMKRIMGLSPSTAAVGIGQEAAHVAAWRNLSKRKKEFYEDNASWLRYRFDTAGLKRMRLDNQAQKETMGKQALSAQHQGMLIGGLGGAGLGAGIGGLLGGWRGAGIGGLAGAGIGTLTGAALGPMATGAYEKYKNRQKFLRKREGEMKRIMQFSPSTAAAGIGREAAHLTIWRNMPHWTKEMFDDPWYISHGHPFDKGMYGEYLQYVSPNR